ncbi:MAG: hypothetical protein ACK2U2_15865 [Anaerolineae bacterium]|jgi:hypothetical protein
MLDPRLTAAEARAQDITFVAQCSLDGLGDRLPLLWPIPDDVSPSPKLSYRSHYVYRRWEDLNDPASWEHLSDFDLLLRLIDFSPLRDVLAERLGWTSARGYIPFDPVSIFLLIGWRIVNGWSRTQLLKNLRNPLFASYAERFGFEDSVFPTEGGLRHWLTALGLHSQTGDTITVGEQDPVEVAVEYLNDLIEQSVALFLDAGFITPEAWSDGLICPDGMIHDAASRLRCGCVTDTCYQPTSSDKPRPCPAKEKDLRGCDCDTVKCVSICRRATPRDPQARFIRYRGSNQPDTDDEQGDPKKGEPRYGYASLPLLLADPTRRFHLILLDYFSPANARQEVPFAAQLLQLRSRYPTLHVKDVVGDAAFGYSCVLRVVHETLKARRVIDLRAHQTDRDKSQWPLRGYDDKGRPICTFGYPFTSNGFDFDKRRHKWFCGRACQNGRQPVVAIEDLPDHPSECPYLHTDTEYGQVLNVGFSFENDGACRLVRDVAVGSPTWKRLYHRARNASESRNATFEHWALKRLPVYGEPRGKAFIFLADVWSNLTTLARLFREATAATGA